KGKRNFADRLRLIPAQLYLWPFIIKGGGPGICAGGGACPSIRQVSPVVNIQRRLEPERDILPFGAARRSPELEDFNTDVFRRFLSTALLQGHQSGHALLAQVQINLGVLHEADEDILVSVQFSFKCGSD